MSKKTLNARNLEALGAARLAALVLELSASDREARRRVRLELTHAAGGSALAGEVRKRLATIARARGFVDWSRRKAFARDLETQFEMIVSRLAPEAPDEAFDLAWRFLDLAPGVEARVDDGRGDVAAVFERALDALPALAAAARPDPTGLADRVADTLTGAGLGAWDGLITRLGEALGPAGLDRLKTRLDAEATAGLPEHADPASWTARARPIRLRRWRQEIADAEGDVDAYVAAFSADELRRPALAAAAAARLTRAGRPDDALVHLMHARDNSRARQPGPDWHAAHEAAFDAAGHREALQDARWARFHETLSTDALRAYLKALPDFEDIEAEDAARSHARAHPDLAAALRFFLDWGDARGAGDLIQIRAAELDGDDYGLLTPAAEALEAATPLAAVLCLRAMVAYTLDHARATRYRHAARHVRTCARLDTEIADYGVVPDHAAYVAALRTDHPRKEAFWRAVDPG